MKYIIDKLEDVPESERSNYVEHQGKYKLNVEGAADAADVTHLQNRLTHADAELKDKQTEWEKTAAAHLAEREKLETKIATLEKNVGAGAGPNGAPIQTNEPNPFKKETFNLTKQADLVKKDPAKARALKDKAQQ